MKPAAFSYHRAKTPSEAADMLADLENARLLAGGQSLMPMMNMRLAMFDHLIDLNPVTGLAGIEFGQDIVRIGAMTRQRSVLESTELRRRLPIFAEALGHVGHLQTRNRGTVGGSMAHMDPAAEIMGLAALLSARLTAVSKRGTRTIEIGDFPIAYMTPSLEPDEVLTEAAFELWPPGHGWDFREMAQRHGDFAVVGVGTMLSLDGEGSIDRVAIALIGVDNGPRRLIEAEEMLRGAAPGAETFEAAGAAAGALDMMEDALVSSAYRRKLAAVLVRRSLANAAARAEKAG